MKELCGYFATHLSNIGKLYTVFHEYIWSEQKSYFYFYFCTSFCVDDVR